jgi:hypothetical protein
MKKLNLSILLCFAAMSFPAPTHALTIEAVKARVRSIGGEQNEVWNLWSNGEVGDFFQFEQAGRYPFRVQAYGSPAGGGWPEMGIMVDDRQLSMMVLSSAQPSSFEFPFEVKRGTHRLVVSFSNDLMIGKEDRNLYVVSLAVESTSGLPTPLIGDAEVWKRERQMSSRNRTNTHTSTQATAICVICSSRQALKVSAVRLFCRAASYCVEAAH